MPERPEARPHLAKVDVAGSIPAGISLGIDRAAATIQARGQGDLAALPPLCHIFATLGAVECPGQLENAVLARVFKSRRPEGLVVRFHPPQPTHRSRSARDLRLAAHRLAARPDAASTSLAVRSLPRREPHPSLRSGDYSRRELLHDGWPISSGSAFDRGHWEFFDVISGL
jgi:hypothetical protein